MDAWKVSLVKYQNKEAMSSSHVYDAEFIKAVLDNVVLWRYDKLVDDDRQCHQLNIRLPKTADHNKTLLIIINLVGASNKTCLTIDSVIIDVVSPSVDPGGSSSFSGYRGGDVLMCPIHKHA